MAIGPTFKEWPKGFKNNYNTDKYREMKKIEKNRLLEMISDKLPVNKKKYWLYKVLGNIIPIALIVLAFIFKEPRLNLLLLVSVFVNIEINRSVFFM